MNKLVFFPLFVLTIFMIFSMLFTMSNVNDYSGTLPINGSQTINGSISTVDQSLQYSFGISLTQGFVAFIITIIGIGIGAGIKVVGTGLDSVTVMLIIKGTFYLSLWGIMSAFAYTLITAIWLVGAVIYLVLTLLYIIGFIETINMAGGSE